MNFQLFYLSTNESELTITKKLDYSKSGESWPKDITGALYISEENIYLFKEDKYCVRGWKCTKANHCVSHSHIYSDYYT